MSARAHDINAARHDGREAGATDELRDYYGNSPGCRAAWRRAYEEARERRGDINAIEALVRVHLALGVSP